jgi:hypothetical protein
LAKSPKPPPNIGGGGLSGLGDVEGEYGEGDGEYGLGLGDGLGDMLGDIEGDKEIDGLIDGETDGNNDNETYGYGLTLGFALTLADGLFETLGDVLGENGETLFGLTLGERLAKMLGYVLVETLGEIILGETDTLGLVVVIDGLKSYFFALIEGEEAVYLPDLYEAVETGTDNELVNDVVDGLATLMLPLAAFATSAAVITDPNGFPVLARYSTCRVGEAFIFAPICSVIEDMDG